MIIMGSLKPRFENETRKGRGMGMRHSSWNQSPNRLEETSARVLSGVKG
jgi:hypothetical protein